MGLYSRVVFPWGYDFFMFSAVKDEARRVLLSGVQGEILEIGVGTCLNLVHNPSIITDPGFGIVELHEYYMRDDPRTHGYTYQGVAEKPEGQQGG